MNVFSLAGCQISKHLESVDRLMNRVLAYRSTNHAVHGRVSLAKFSPTRKIELDRSYLVHTILDLRESGSGSSDQRSSGQGDLLAGCISGTGKEPRKLVSSEAGRISSSFRLGNNESGTQVRHAFCIDQETRHKQNSNHGRRAATGSFCDY